LPVCVLALSTRWRIPVVILSKIVTMIFIALIVYYGIEVFQSRFHRISTSLDLYCHGDGSFERVCLSARWLHSRFSSRVTGYRQAFLDRFKMERRNDFLLRLVAPAR